MNIPYRYRPGHGFLLLVATLILGAGFFTWGLLTPPLDKVWRMQVELKIGDCDVLTRDEMRLLQHTLSRYPDVADHMLEGADSGLISASVGGIVDRGYAYFVRKSADSPDRLVVTSLTGQKLKVTALTTTDFSRGVATGDAPFIWTLPVNGPFPQLVGVYLARSAQHVTPRSNAFAESTAVVQPFSGTEVAPGYPTMQVALSR